MNVSYAKNFSGLCKDGKLREAQELYLPEENNITKYAFEICCKFDQLEVAKWLYSIEKITKDECNQAFLWSCYNGHFNIAKWLYSLGGIDIHIENEDAFRVSCEQGYLDMSQWLYSLGNIDVHLLRDSTIKSCCLYEQRDVVKWLLLIDKFDEQLIDEHLPTDLYEYAIQLGYIGANNMKPTYERYKLKIKEQLIEKNNEGDISLFEMDGLVDMIIQYF